MAREFTRRGLPSVAVSAETSGEEREAALRDLRGRRVNVVFCVDLFNEGVDVPEVDTLLFLRPTESALVFLQQLGRGLRRAEGKDCLTVLDFIGGANRRFRFYLRFRALLGGLVAELRAMADGRRHAGGDPASITLADFLRDAAVELEDLYKTAGWTWSRLRREAGLQTAGEGPDEAQIARGVPQLLHLDDPDRPLEGRSRDVVALTKSGRDLLESSRLERGDEPRPAFYAGLKKPRELTHDAQVYRAYLRTEERLHGRGASVRRVVLDYELKREGARGQSAPPTALDG